MKPLAVLALALALPAGAAASEKEDVLWSRLRAKVQDVEKRLDGVLGLSVKDLKTGTTFEVRPDEVFPHASTIKLAAVYELYRQAGDGKINLAQVTQPPMPRVKGGGVLQELGDKVSVSWRDLAVMMVAWSDNEATNVLNDTQTALLVRKAMLEALPAIIAAAAKPMEQIDKISILDARGLHGDGGGSDLSDGSGNLADSAVAAAMRYRVGGPLIDALMGELGLNGSSLNTLLAGAAAPEPKPPAVITEPGKPKK